MPPAIQRRMQVSAVGWGCLTGSFAGSGWGSSAASVARAAALMPRRKSRRLTSGTVGEKVIIVRDSLCNFQSGLQPVVEPLLQHIGQVADHPAEDRKST